MDRPRRRREERAGGADASADDLTDTLMAFDRNSDGHLDRAEVPERFQGLFDRADTNKDGALTREELKQSATATAQEGRRRGATGAVAAGRWAIRCCARSTPITTARCRRRKSPRRPTP